MKVSLICLLFLCSCALYAGSIYPFEKPKQAAQFTYMLKELRCLVCQNQDLADSNSELARDLRQEVYRLVNEGQSDAEIKAYLTQRYGDFILFKPPMKSVTVLLWLGPVLFLVLGFLIFWRSIRTAWSVNNG